MSFKEFIFDQFPEFYQNSDTYKNSEGKGIFQRFCETLGMEFDEEIVPYIENLTNLLDFRYADAKYLPLLGGLIGAPQFTGITEEAYRKLLENLIYIYQIKGTKESFEKLFSIFGYSIELLSDINPLATYYDDVAKYDDGSTYDNLEKYYTYFDIKFYNLITGDLLDYSTMSQTERNLIDELILFLKPINSRFMYNQLYEAVYETTYE